MLWEGLSPSLSLGLWVSGSLLFFVKCQTAFWESRVFKLLTSGFVDLWGELPPLLRLYSVPVWMESNDANCLATLDSKISIIWANIDKTYCFIYWRWWWLLILSNVASRAQPTPQCGWILVLARIFGFERGSMQGILGIGREPSRGRYWRLPEVGS